MQTIENRLREVEAELAKQDRELGSALAVLQHHVAADTELELSDALLSELEEAFGEVDARRRPLPPATGARC